MLGARRKDVNHLHRAPEERARPSTGHQVYALEVPPVEFHRRASRTSRCPPSLSERESADGLGVSQQRALQLVNSGQRADVKVGDTWVLPRLPSPWGRRDRRTP
jgi:hypothetical protein